MKKIENLWNMPVDTQDISEAGLHLEIEAPEAVRTALAAMANLREISRIHATFDLSRRGAGIHVIGQLKARVGQTCIVSLEPIESDIEEPIDLLFVPGAAAADHSLQMTPGGEEPPELLVDGKVDLGGIATEFLLLGIDFYPRKPGVEFSAPKAENIGNRPFAGLEALKKRLDRD